MISTFLIKRINETKAKLIQEGYKPKFLLLCLASYETLIIELREISDFSGPISIESISGLHVIKDVIPNSMTQNKYNFFIGVAGEGTTI